MSSGPGLRRDQVRHERLTALQKKRENIEKKADETRQEAELTQAAAKRRKTAAASFGASQADVLEEAFKQQTVGLTSVEEFREKRRNIDELIEQVEASELASANAAASKKKIIQNVKKSQLSFAEAEDSDADGSSEEAHEVEPQRRASKKNPNVDTSFLRDDEREREAQRRREELIEEYKAMEAKAKKELIPVTFSYWDGSGHRRQLSIEQGATVGQFLKAARAVLVEDFAEIRHVGSEDLLFVKEDLILPHKVSFYELVRDKARGKSGPLFDFGASAAGVDGMVRQGQAVATQGDIRVQGLETHAAKIVVKKWYESHKHIFPQSKWEKYDPSKSYDNK